ncbi:MAG: hypothetical protein IJ274_14140 [Lachnospiraceae bacterium]|nr:hypothetical protein [Lachnospiraceae bacterium]
MARPREKWLSQKKKREKVPLPGGAGRKEEVEVYTTKTGAPNLCWEPLQ